MWCCSFDRVLPAENVLLPGRSWVALGGRLAQRVPAPSPFGGNGMFQLLNTRFGSEEKLSEEGRRGSSWWCCVTCGEGASIGIHGPSAQLAGAVGRAEAALTAFRGVKHLSAWRERWVQTPAGTKSCEEPVCAQTLRDVGSVILLGPQFSLSWVSAEFAVFWASLVAGRSSALRGGELLGGMRLISAPAPAALLFELFSSDDTAAEVPSRSRILGWPSPPRPDRGGAAAVSAGLPRDRGHAGSSRGPILSS